MREEEKALKEIEKVRKEAEQEECKRRRGSTTGGGAEGLCGILLNCPSK